MKKLSSNEIKKFLLVNKSECKILAIKVLPELLKANEELRESDISTIISPEFYNDLNDIKLSIPDAMDNHFIGYMGKFSFPVLLSLHNIYNK